MKPGSDLTLPNIQHICSRRLWKHCGNRSNLLVVRNFFFCHNVFKSFLLQGTKKSLYKYVGKRLIIIYKICRWRGRGGRRGTTRTVQGWWKWWRLWRSRPALLYLPSATQPKVSTNVHVNPLGYNFFFVSMQIDQFQSSIVTLSKHFSCKTPYIIEKSYLLALKQSKENVGSCIMQERTHQAKKVTVILDQIGPG